LKLSELEPEVKRATEEMVAQDKYVQVLGAKITAGEKTIKVYDDPTGTWTVVSLTEFWQIQYNKYLALSGYAGDMNGLLTNLQTVLDEALKSIVKPDDRKVPVTA
jgi:hypothetical protein